jgi:hypothetical protein
MVALLPVKFPVLFINVLRLFVNIKEEDLLATFTNKLYTTDYKNSKIYTPVNQYFSFSSIYTRIRGLKILLRLIVNCLFFFLIKKLSSYSANSTQVFQTAKMKIANNKKSKRLKLGLKMLLQFIVSLDYINLVPNLLFIGTSVSVKVSVFDFVVIFIDLFSLIFFQFELINLLRRYKGREIGEIKDVLDKGMLTSAFYRQNEDKLSFPFSML